MGFPVGYTEVFLPKLLIQTLAVLGFIRSLIFFLLRSVGLSDYLEPDDYFDQNPTQIDPLYPPASIVLTREYLPVVQYGDLRAGAGVLAGENCAVCLCEFSGADEIRFLINCKHIFHRSCVDRWMDHDQNTCPLCRTPFVPRDLQDEFNQRLWAASDYTRDFIGDSTTVSAF